jgi:hypothetical protein
LCTAKSTPRYKTIRSRDAMSLAARLDTSLRHGIRCQHLDFLLQSSLEAVLLHFEIVPRLEVQPETLRQAKVARQPEGRVGRDRTLAADDLVDAAWVQPMSFASRYWLIPIGLRNSSSRISPGCTDSNVSVTAPPMIIYHLDGFCQAVHPRLGLWHSRLADPASGGVRARLAVLCTAKSALSTN